MHCWVFFLMFKIVFAIGNYICNPHDSNDDNNTSNDNNNNNSNKI